MRSRAFLISVAMIASLISSTMPLRGQDLKRPEEQLAAIYSLKVQLEIEQHRLDDALQKYNEQARAREEARGRLSRLYDDLDAMVQGRSDADRALMQSREDEIAQVEQMVQALTQETRQTRAEIRDAHARIELLDERIGRLRKTLPSDSESLTGTWDVSYLPSGDKGVFALRQSGTLLVGEYTLEGGWKGSLQGTFVGGKVLLHRIDSKLGRSSDLDGTLAPDGRTIRGTWQNFILSGGEPTSGQWVARKRQEKSEN
ncbi:MAG TPA: hypothetical protein VKF61_10325 [Candidatus Polarisedimenticolia bacterium]|nr:hypothetical protein [Candidatus Polarisedimenticolia bacterium]